MTSGIMPGQQGLEAVEANMTQRYVENLKRYQEAGFFTDIAVE